MIEEEKLVALPVEMISTGGALFLRRGSLEIKISGECASQVVHTILKAASNDGVTRKGILNSFAAPDQPAVDQLIDHLISRKILLSSQESKNMPKGSEDETDIFYWHFGEWKRPIVNNLNSKTIAILGVNAISRRIGQSLSESDIDSFSIIDDPMLRNQHIFDEDKLKVSQWPGYLKPPIDLRGNEGRSFLEKADCLVLTCDFGINPIISYWNEFCVENKRTFYPIILDRLVGYIGPMVVPGETACYECLRRRENSNMYNFEDKRATEAEAFHHQSVNGFLPPMASILADIAIVDLIRFWSDSLVLMPKVGNMMEIRLMVPEIKNHKVLKLPRCPVCSPLKKRSSSTIDKNSFLAEETLAKRDVRTIVR